MARRQHLLGFWSVPGFGLSPWVRRSSLRTFSPVRGRPSAPFHRRGNRSSGTMQAIWPQVNHRRVSGAVLLHSDQPLLPAAVTLHCLSPPRHLQPPTLSEPCFQKQFVFPAYCPFPAPDTHSSVEHSIHAACARREEPESSGEMKTRRLLQT